MKKLLDIKIKIFLYLLIIFIPVSGLILTYLSLKSSLSESTVFWITHWYEPVAIVLLIFAIIINLIYKKLNCSWSVIIAAILSVFGAISIFFLSESIPRGVEGFRFTLFALIIFLLASQIDWREVSSKKITNSYLIVATIIALLALVERLFPLNYWVNILGSDSTFGYGNFSIVSAHQSSSLLTGPNQLASYLLPAVFIMLGSLGFSKVRDFDSKTLRFLLFCVYSAAIIFTFSRSSFLGLALGLIIFFIISLIKFRLSSTFIKYILATILVFIFSFLVYTYANMSDATKDFFTHGQSQSQHVDAYKVAFSEIKSRVNQPIKLVFGSGIGSAGPLSIKYGNGFVSESWYLQLALELGIFGLLLWISLMVSALINLWKKAYFGLFVAIIAVSIAALFLHTWADNPAVAITLFALVGASGSSKSIERM